MPNKPLVKEILSQIEIAIDTIKFRFKPVDSNVCKDDINSLHEIIVLMIKEI